MKTAQWVAVLLIAAGIVFGLTFAVNYLGRGGTSKSKPAAGAAKTQLTWADEVTNYPSDQSTGPAVGEIGRNLSHDFWFKNETAQTAPVGVFSKSCQCLGIVMWVAKDRKDVPYAADRDKAVKELEAAGPPTELKENAGVVDVPPGAVGVVRLAWPGERPGPKNLVTELWMGEKSADNTRRFEIRSLFMDPLEVASTEVPIGDLSQEKLPYDVSFKCWSATRREFALSANMLQHHLKKEASDLFVVGVPVPLTDEDLAKMRKERKIGPALSGYTIHVTLLKESRDGTPFDVGTFHRRIELELKDADLKEPARIQVVIDGAIQGDLAVVGDPVPVKFGSFYRNQNDKMLDVLVESGADVTALEVDKQRTADFLGVEIPEPAKESGGRKTWRLQVKWLPESQAGGEFPRDADDYRDSAVYVRPVMAKAGATPLSCLRIPVVGKADTPP